MKTRIFLGLCILLGAGFISARAADAPSQATAPATDNPAQAASRAALEQKLNDLDNPQTSQTPKIPRALRIPITLTPFGTVVKHRFIYA